VTHAPLGGFELREGSRRATLGFRLPRTLACPSLSSCPVAVWPHSTWLPTGAAPPPGLPAFFTAHYHHLSDSRATTTSQPPFGFVPLRRTVTFLFLCQGRGPATPASLSCRSHLHHFTIPTYLPPDLCLIPSVVLHCLPCLHTAPPPILPLAHGGGPAALCRQRHLHTNKMPMLSLPPTWAWWRLD